MKKIRYFGNTGKTLEEIIYEKKDYVDADKEAHGRWLDEKWANETQREITFWPEGSLIKTSGVPFYEDYEHDRPGRGVITGFSAKSQRRMLEFVATLNRDALPIFVTLTYPRSWSGDPDTWKANLDFFCTWLGRKHAGSCALWKLEPQERGAPHFHLMIWGVEFLPWQDVAWEWARIIHDHTLLDACKKPRNQPGKNGAWVFRQLVEFMPLPEQCKATLSAGVRVEAIRSARGVKSYVAKNYMGKVCDMPEGWGAVGRFWGVRGRKSAPNSIQVKFKVTVKTQAKFRRLGRRFMLSKGYRGKQYSRILTDNPLQWVRALDLLESGRCDAWHMNHVQCGPGERGSVADVMWDWEEFGSLPDRFAFFRGK